MKLKLPPVFTFVVPFGLMLPFAPALEVIVYCVGAPPPTATVIDSVTPSIDGSGCSFNIAVKVVAATGATNCISMVQLPVLGSMVVGLHVDVFKIVMPDGRLLWS